MKIEITEKGTEGYYREVVCAVMQYRNVLKKPDMELQDSFEQTKRSLYISIGLFVVLGVLTIFWGAGLITIIALTLSAVNIAFCFAHMKSLKNSLQNVMGDTRKTTLILDENGVALDKDGTQVIRFAWDSIAFLRIYDLTMCFFAKEGTGVITVNRAYEEPVMKYIKENGVAVRII